MLILHSTKAYARDTTLDDIGVEGEVFLLPLTFYLHDVRYFRQGEDKETRPKGVIVTLFDDSELHIQDSYTDFAKTMKDFVDVQNAL